MDIKRKFYDLYLICNCFEILYCTIVLRYVFNFPQTYYNIGILFEFQIGCLVYYHFVNPVPVR